MYSLERLFDIWDYEIRTFGGQPEFADSMYERAEDTFGSSEVRATGKSLQQAPVDVRTWLDDAGYVVRINTETWDVEYITKDATLPTPSGLKDNEIGSTCSEA